ncbi:uncharacterized protein [Elaeis guineensis]|uniref:Uncharacterized protein LOC105035631 isoform X2 n=1 Tax=Elaeis guineensis var. tenera TaxID=51953 RepID=A0A8N4F1Z0_ELAGV|nr:uncharacterized protein LOC105035631 isoform X2 [Elaeis guineensis]XP_029117832.1 uncharacterized protein LOC105035631 isoform X2 [Elaeis guineensis]
MAPGNVSRTSSLPPALPKSLSLSPVPTHQNPASLLPDLIPVRVGRRSDEPNSDDIAALDLNTSGGQEQGSTAVEAKPASDPGGSEKGGGEFMVETLEQSREGFLDTGDGDSARKPETDVGEEGGVAGSEEVSGTVAPEGAEVGESSSGTGIELFEEKLAAFGEKGQRDMANKVTERDLVHGCFQATEVGSLGSRGQETGDGCSRDQELRADVLETGNMVGIAVEEAKDERLESMADLGGSHEVVVKIRNGTEPMEEDASFPEKKSSAMSDQRSSHLVDGQSQLIESNAGPSELVARDELGGKQKLKLNVKEAESMMWAAKAATRGTVGAVEVDGLEGEAANDGGKVDVLETGSKTEPLVEDEAFLEKEQSTAIDVMVHDMVDEQLQSKEGVLDPKGLDMEAGLGSEWKSEINVVDGECVVECGKGNELVKEQITNQNSDCEVRDQDLVDEHLQAAEEDVGSVALEAENELGGQEMLEANGGDAGFGVGTVKTLARVEADSLAGVADMGQMHVGVAEVGNGTELTEEGVSCLQKDESMAGKVTDLPRAQGALGPKMLKTKDFLDGDQKLKADVLEVECLMGAAKTQVAVDLGGEEAQKLRTISELGQVQHKVPGTSGTGLTREGVSCPQKNWSLVTEKGGRGLADASLQASEGDSSQNQFVIMENTAGTKDMDEGFEGSLMSSDQDRIHEASVSQTSFVDTNQNDQERGNDVKYPNLADPGVEVNSPDSNHAHDDTVGSGHLLTAESKAGLVNSVVHAAALSADKHPTDEIARDRDIITADGGSVLDVTFMESESRGTQLVDEDTGDRKDITMDNSVSDLESQFAQMGPLGLQTAETCPVGEKLTDRKDSVLKDSNLAVTTGLPMASELSEIQTIVSQQKEIVECIPSRNQETQPQSIGLLVGRSDAIVHEAQSSPGLCQNMDMESRIRKDGTSLPEACHGKGDLARDSEADKKTSMLVDSVANIVTGPDGTAEQNMQVDEQEHPKIACKEIVKHVGIRPGVCSTENDQHAIYFLPLQDKDTFSISDLVWGKVKSHPWWPGQIFYPSDASDLAVKYQKKDNFLVAYFGDKTFAWCEEPQLKPFETYFSQMEKQTSSDAFVNAVNDALGEVSRRTELGMTCFCLPEGAYANIKCQMVENAGIREGVSGFAFDRSPVVDYFQADRLLEYIEALAQLPSGGANRLELVIAQAQLKAFYQSKGYPELPVFQVGGGLMEKNAEVSPSDGKLVGEDTMEHFTPTPMELNLGKRKRGRGRPSNKEKRMLEDAKKQKNLSELMEESIVSLANGGKLGFAEKVDGDLISLSSEKKRNVIDFDSDYSEKTKKKRLDSLGDLFTKSPSSTPASSFKVGECIRRVASQLTGSPPILRCHGETFQKSVSKAEHRRFDVDTEASTHTAMDNPRMKVVISDDCSSLDEMLWQLCLAARDPMKGYSFLSMIVSFFTDFRNFCVSSSSMEKKHAQKIRGRRGRKRTVSTQSPSCAMSTPDHMQDSYWSDMIYYNSSTNDLKRKGDTHMRSQRKRRKSGGETSISLSLDRMLGTAQNLQVGTISPKMKQASTTERSVISLEEKIVDECTPTALILSFNGSSSLPSEMDLIRIFSRYGPLKEAETEVQRKTNHVKVVFKKRADAEIAFRSAGKYSIFGPALLSYRLRYLPSTLSACPNTTTQGPDDAGSIEGGKLVVPGDGSPNTISGKHDAVPTEGGNSEVPGDVSPNTTPQGENDAVSIEGGNSEVPGGNSEVPGDVSPTATPQYKGDAVPTESGKLEFPSNSTPNITPHNKNDAVPAETGNLEVPGSTSADSTQDKNVVPAKGHDLEVPDDIYPNTTREKNNSAPIEDGSLEVPGNTSPNSTTQDKNDAAPIENGSLDVPCDTSPSTTTPDKNDPGNSYANIATQDKNDAVSIEGGNLEVPAEIGAVSDTIQDGVVDKGSVEGVV